MMLVRMGAPLAACLAILCVAPTHAQQSNMTFFVTSVGPGKGADLGGLAGADQHCQRLASSVGAAGKTGPARGPLLETSAPRQVCCGNPHPRRHTGPDTWSLRREPARPGTTSTGSW